MNPLADPFHEEVARLALAASRDSGFALGGGNALVAHGVVSRLTEDIDLFSDVAGAAAQSAEAVRAALQEAGFRVDEVPGTSALTEIFEDFALDMVEFEVVRDEHAVRLSLARLDRLRPPVSSGIGPLLHLDDVLGSKVAALASRAEIRDYVDVAAALRLCDRGELLALAHRLDPGLNDGDFAGVARRLDSLPDRVFADYDLDSAQVAELRARFADWPRT